MKKPIPKSIEDKIRKYGEYQRRANILDYEIRRWLYKNNYDRVTVDMLIESGQVGEVEWFIRFLNGEPDKYGQVIDNLFNDNSQLEESDYI